MNKKLAVVAFGGNALLRAGQKGEIHEQRKNVYETCKSLIPLIKKEYNLLIAHGNGPQVGNAMLSNLAAHKMFNLPLMPMDICGSYTQGYIGYIIEQQMKNLLKENSCNKDICTLVTQVVVDKNDKAFQNPTKPVGPYYTEEEKNNLLKQNPDETYAADPKGKGYRKVVASPVPIEVCNINSIKKLIEAEHIVVTVGGGGIPVYQNNDNLLEGVEAVIDKDLASALLASKIGADEFYILTDVPKVCLNFNTPNEIKLDKINLAEAKKYLAEGHFTEGSMAPKIRASIFFMENGGKECIITDSTQMGIENAGTRIVK